MKEKVTWRKDNAGIGAKKDRKWKIRKKGNGRLKRKRY